jgi:hypothetical protein
MRTALILEYGQLGEGRASCGTDRAPKKPRTLSIDGPFQNGDLINIFLSIEYQDFVDYGFTINFYEANSLPTFILGESRLVSSLSCSSVNIPERRKPAMGALVERR